MFRKLQSRPFSPHVTAASDPQIEVVNASKKTQTRATSASRPPSPRAPSLLETEYRNAHSAADGVLRSITRHREAAKQRTMPRELIDKGRLAYASELLEWLREAPNPQNALRTLKSVLEACADLTHRRQHEILPLPVAEQFVRLHEEANERFTDTDQRSARRAYLLKHAGAVIGAPGTFALFVAQQALALDLAPASDAIDAPTLEGIVMNGPLGVSIDATFDIATSICRGNYLPPLPPASPEERFIDPTLHFLEMSEDYAFTRLRECFDEADAEVFIETYRKLRAQPGSEESTAKPLDLLLDIVAMSRVDHTGHEVISALDESSLQRVCAAAVEEIRWQMNFIQRQLMPNNLRDTVKFESVDRAIRKALGLVS